MGRRNLRNKMNRKNKSPSVPPGQFEAPSGQGQGQALNVEEASINNFPPEMLMKIFEYLDTRSLFALLFVNVKWCAVASGILCRRPDAKILFELTPVNNVLWRTGTVFLRGKKCLKDFVSCMENCEDVPFAHFQFKISFGADPTKLFDHPHFTQFLSLFSSTKSSSSEKCQNPTQRIKGLDFTFCEMRAEKLEIVAAKCGDFLLNKTPFLENLSLEFEGSPNEAQVKLFPTPNQKHANINPDQLLLPVPVAPEFQLPHLKVLRFTTRMISDQTGILQDLLSAAINLEKIYLQPTETHFELTTVFNNFEFLQSLGKFHLLKNFEFSFSEKCLETFISRPDFPRALLDLKLEESALGTTTEYQNLNHDDKTRATSFISALFESSKDSLNKLRMAPLGSLTTLQFPQFKNLTQLKLQEAYYSTPTYFPRGVRALDIFPAVRQLDLPKNWCRTLGPVDSTPVFPSVPSLSVDDTEFSPSSVSVLALLCPNLKHLRIYRAWWCRSATQLNFLPVAPEIWTKMTQLESLQVDIQKSQHSTLQLDSCFTGFSEETIRHLYEKREETSGIWTLDEPQLKPELKSKSEAELTAVRERPSISDMKSLKRIRINYYEKTSSGWSKMDPELFSDGKPTWISREQLPNLEIN